MPAAASGLWFPRLVGTLALVSGFYDLAWCAVRPPSAGMAVVLGFPLVGPDGWMATGAQGVFLLWLGYTCMRRKAIAAWALIGYFVYWIENIWIYSTGQGRGLFGSTYSMILLDVFVTGVLLTFCRVVLSRRADFNR